MNVTMYWPATHGPAEESYPAAKEMAGDLGFIGQSGQGNLPKLCLALLSEEYSLVSAEELRRLRSAAPVKTVEEVVSMPTKQFKELLGKLRSATPQRDGRYVFQSNPPSEYDGVWSLMVTEQPRNLLNYSTGKVYIETSQEGQPARKASRKSVSEELE